MKLTTTLKEALLRWATVLAVGFGGGLAGAAAFSAWRGPAANAREAGLPSTQFASLPAATGDAPTDFAMPAEAATDAVVFIQTLSGSRRSDEYWSFWDFFGSRGPISSAGSGVIISEGGYIVTNYHVVQNAERIDVSLRNKHTYPAKLVGVDPNTDLALLRIEATGLRPLPTANSDEVRIGDWVLAIGNPFNLQYTVTAGIVSAKGRNINILNSQFPIESFIQTDAAINPGNSGGALVNLQGQLVGINAAIASRTGTYNGYGFAIPSNIVRKVVQDLTEFGSVQRAFIGAEVRDIDSEVGRDLPDGDYSGVRISTVERDGAAAATGLQPGDVVLQINDARINTKAEFLEHLSYYRPGDKIRVVGRRDGKPVDKTVTLTNADGGTGMVRREVYRSDELGADLVALSKVERSKYNVTGGYRVENIRGGRIAQLRLPEGFVFLRINGYEPESPEQVAKLLLGARGRIVVQGIQPNGQRVDFSFLNY